MKKILYTIFAFAALFVLNSKASAAYTCIYTFKDIDNYDYTVHFIYNNESYTYTCISQGSKKSNAIDKAMICGNVMVTVDQATQTMLKDGSVTNKTCGNLRYEELDMELYGGKYYNHYQLSLTAGGTNSGNTNNNTNTDNGGSNNNTANNSWSCTYFADIDGVSTPIFFKNEDGKTTLTCGADVNNIKYTWNHCGDKTFIFSEAVKAQVSAMASSCALNGMEFKLTGNILDLVAKPQESTNKRDNSYAKIVCGDIVIPMAIPKVVTTLFDIMKIVTPIIIILLGSIDLVKGVMAQKEDDIKKGQQTFVKRLLAGVLVFMAFFIVELVVGIFAPKEKATNWNCVDCFINGNCSEVGKNN